MLEAKEMTTSIIEASTDYRNGISIHTGPDGSVMVDTMVNGKTYPTFVPVTGEVKVFY
jgi:hypothetical protein